MRLFGIVICSGPTGCEIGGVVVCGCGGQTARRLLCEGRVPDIACLSSRRRWLKVGGPRVLFGYHRGSGGLLSGEQGREQWQRLVLMMCTFQTERRTGVVAMTEGVSGLVWSGGGRVSTGKGQGEEEADPWAWPRGEGCPGRRSLITVEATRRWRDRKRGAGSRFALGNR